LESTRIVLIDMPPLLRDVVRNVLSGEPDIEVVAEHDAAVDVGDAVEADEADLVIAGSDVASSALREAVARDRGVRALEVRSDGKESVLYELRPHRVPLGEISPETLLRTIRAVPTWENETAETQGGEMEP
jgi:DNA-binding NarL/FixJ family response regulator